MEEIKVTKRTRSEEDEPVREGDVLGLGGSPVPKAPGDPSTEFDAESRARRHQRAAGDDDLVRESDTTRTPGATGIDMGSGGTGTDVE
jgi:hypothetical protein